MAKQYSALTKFTIALSAMHQPFILVGEGTTTQTVSMQSDTEKNRFVDFIFDDNGKSSSLTRERITKTGSIPTTAPVSPPTPVSPRLRRTDRDNGNGGKQRATRLRRGSPNARPRLPLLI